MQAKDALAAAKKRGQKTKTRMLREHRCLTTAEVVSTKIAEQQLGDEGLTVEEIETLGRKGLLLAVEHKGQLFFPEFQFHNDYRFDALYLLLLRSGLDPWMIFVFFVSTFEDLNSATPLDRMLLMDRGYERVRELACIFFGDQGAA